MSACSQAKAKRRQMRNGYAALGGNPKRPRSSALSRANAARQSSSKSMKKASA